MFYLSNIVLNYRVSWLIWFKVWSNTSYYKYFLIPHEVTNHPLSLQLRSVDTVPTLCPPLQRGQLITLRRGSWHVLYDPETGRRGFIYFRWVDVEDPTTCQTQVILILLGDKENLKRDIAKLKRSIGEANSNALKVQTQYIMLMMRRPEGGFGWVFLVVVFLEAALTIIMLKMWFYLLGLDLRT